MVGASIGSLVLGKSSSFRLGMDSTSHEVILTTPMTITSKIASESQMCD